MEALEDILEISANFDIRLETLAATLLAQAEGQLRDFGLEHIVVEPIGSAKRRYSGDIEVLKKKYYATDEAILLRANRKGLFDTLPQELFLRLDEAYDSPKARTKAIAQQIKDARKFFLPFEQAIYHPRIEAEQIEQKYTEGFPDFIHKIWGLDNFDDILTDRQKFLLCYLLPEAYRVVGNWQLTGLCFEAVMQKPINLRFTAPMQLENPKKDIPADEVRLGDNAIIGNEFQDDMPALQVEIRGVTYPDLPDYLEDGKNRRILEDLLYSYFIPLDIPVTTKIVVTEDALGFNLGEAVLGYNIEL